MSVDLDRRLKRECKSVILGVRLTSREYALLRQAAHKIGRTPSEICRMLIREWLRKRMVEVKANC